MNKEYEVRILNIDKAKIEEKLQKLNAEFAFERLQKRYVYDFNPIKPNKWIRLRTDGCQSTLTIKYIANNEIDGVYETEIEVSDFEKTNIILEELGYYHKAYQENKRERYYLNNVEIDIDSWPLIPDYLEIEGKNKEEVYKTLELLEIKSEEITTKDCQSIYLDYGIDLDSILELKLEEERK